MKKRAARKKYIKPNLNAVNGVRHHPHLREELTYGQKAADAIAKFGGSWGFIIGFLMILGIWIGVNIHLLTQYNKTWDPYPFILLNLVLSCLAAIQAPVILMSQNRQAERDRIAAGYDHAVNRKAEREIQITHKKIENLRRLVIELKKK